MILNFTAYSDPFTCDCLFQIVIAAQDVEILCVILYELGLYRELRKGIKCHMFSSERLSTSQTKDKRLLFGQLSLIRNLDKENADGHEGQNSDPAQELEWTLENFVNPDSFHAFSEILETRARTKLQQGNPAASAFCWEKMYRCWSRAVNSNLWGSTPTDEHIMSRIMFLKQQQIEARIQVGNFRDAYRTLAYTITLLRQFDHYQFLNIDIEASLLTKVSLIIAELCHQVGFLDKTGSLDGTMLFALGYYLQAWRRNPHDESLTWKVAFIKRHVVAEFTYHE